MVDPQNIKEIMEWPMPKDVADIDPSWDSRDTTEGSSKGSQIYPILLLPYIEKV